MLNIPIIVGTSRPKRQSIKVARFVEKVAKEHFADQVETVFVDPVDFNMPGDGNDEGNKDPRYTKITAEADGFFIVTPEYNHSFPGSLKRFLDSELKNYIHKPVVFAGVSDGPWGGVRAIEALLHNVRELGLIASFEDVQFPLVTTLFDDQGNIKDEKYVERVSRSFRELIWLANTLKWGVNNLSNKYHE